jgi:septum site-determining protein MinD
MTRFIAIISGKGGTGKTTTTLNLGHALVKNDKSVLLVDANLATPNLGLHLGIIDPKATLNHFLRREKHIRDVIHTDETGISIIPGSPNYIEFQKTNTYDMTKLFQHLDNTHDFVLIDCPSGFGPEVNALLKHTDESIIVANPNISSIMEAVKSIDVARSNNNFVPGIVLNKSKRFSKHQMSKDEVENLLGIEVIETIHLDKKITKAHHKQRPAGDLFPRSKAAKKYGRIAEYISMEHPKMNKK